MIGRTIEASSPVPRSAWLWLFVAVLLIAWAVFGQTPHPALAAILPALVAIGLWWGSPSAVVLTVQENGLAPLGAATPIRYNAMAVIAVGGQVFSGRGDILPDGPIELHHADGVLVIPQQMSASPFEFARFVHSRIPPSDDRPIPAKLADFAAEQRARFGTEKVEIVRVREMLKMHSHRRRNRAIVLALAATGILWMALGVGIGSFVPRGEDFAAWIALGGICFVGAWFVGFALSRGRSVSERLVFTNRDACIVISPAGLALSQAGLEGVLRWDQVRDASTKFGQFMRVRRTSGVRIDITGGEIIVVDIYDRPPLEIERLIRSRLDRPAN